MKKIALLFITVSFSTLLQAQQIFTKGQQEAQQTVVKLFQSLNLFKLIYFGCKLLSFHHTSLKYFTRSFATSETF